MKRQRRSPDAKAAKGTGGSARRPARAPLSPESRALLLATLAAALVLAFGVDERTLGRITDEQQLANTSVALAELGELGVARGQTFAIHRPGGDAVAPYGVGAPLVFSLASRAAAPLELRHGLGASQSLYALLQSLVVPAAALAAGLLAALLALLALELGGPLAGALIDRCGGARWWAAAGALLFATTLAAMAGSRVPATLAMAAVGVVVALVPTAVYTLPGRLVAAESVGFAFGLITSFSNLGTVLGPALAGALRDRASGWPALWAATAAVAAGAALAVLAARPPAERR